MEERGVPDPTVDAGSGATPAPPARSAGPSLFKLRLGATDAGPSLTAAAADAPQPGGSTGNGARIVPSAAAATPTSPAAPMPSFTAILGASASPAAREDDWEEFPAVVHQDDAREYKSDSNFQAMIEALASQITDGDDAAAPKARGTVGAREPRGGMSPSAAASTTPSVSSPKTLSRGDAKRAAKAATKPSPAPSPAPVAASSTVTGSVATAATPAPATPAPAPPAPTAASPELAPAASNVSAAVALDVPADPPIRMVDVPVIVEASPVLSASGEVRAILPTLSGSHRVVDRISGSTEHEIIVPRPVAPSLSQPQLLPKIEPKPGAPRPTKPVDFHSLLKESGMSAPRTAPRRQRHPFRVLFKLLIVVGLIGGGLYYAKLRFLDAKWKPELKKIADDVSSRRGLEWDHAIDLVVLPPDEYALHLASSMLGVSSAQSTALGAEWRAMGLTDGSVDLGAIGWAAMADQPAFYEPADETIYELDGLTPALREVALSRAMTNALLDQHVHWGRTLVSATGVEADPAVRLGVRALYDGDAMSIRSQTTATMSLADPSVLTDVSTELAKMRLNAAPFAEGASPYAVAITGMPGAAARWMFTDQLTPNALNRDKVEELAVSSDAAIFDGVRGRSAAVDNPPSDAVPVPAAATTLAPGATAAPTTVAPAPTTTVALDSATVASAVPTTLPTKAAPGATARGMIFWYYVLAGRLDSAVAWDAALRWQGDGTVFSATSAGKCVDSVVVTKDLGDQQVLLAALTSLAAAGPVASAATVSAMNDTAIAVHSCDPGPSADTFSNDQIPLFGDAPDELLVASAMLSEGLPSTEVARQCVIRTVRTNGLPPLLQSTSVDRSLTEAKMNKGTVEVTALIDACANQ